MIEIALHSDGSERVPTVRRFPLHLSACTLSMYPGIGAVSATGTTTMSSP
jgi:hypothetical protein